MQESILRADYFSLHTEITKHMHLVMEIKEKCGFGTRFVQYYVFAAQHRSYQRVQAKQPYFKKHSRTALVLNFVQNCPSSKFGPELS